MAPGKALGSSTCKQRRGSRKRGPWIGRGSTSTSSECENGPQYEDLRLGMERRGKQASKGVTKWLR
eukprot:1829269-Prorocentrum_lima.AAC.1